MSKSLSPSSEPDIQIFKGFKNSWSDIDQADYKAVSSDASSLQAVENIAAYIISFAQDQLNRYQPRDDYKELLNLTIIYLGGIPEKGVSFRMPAGLHRARWMAKAIYCLKIFLFLHQFKLSKREETAIKEICVFTVSIYVKYWYQAPSACAAPRNDLQLLKDLVSFQNINKAMSQNAIHKILGHLWYLSEELVCLAFFDDALSLDDKRKMIKALNNEGLEFCAKRINVDVKHILEKNIEDFVSSNSMRFFQILGISSQFFR
ncbi:hypothetical protein EVAR_30915_1 [Eumeta japonica]|uniref:Uncharacterized protein n=1 Tax=Eumeta variegata TaxID=151549 RepID=A0A4C1V4N2_EUMVA|nr:hypothetical protein EVAR_30915_1 [Eumeta japonica]